MQTDDFDYTLPAEVIAQVAIEPRHDSRLLIATTGAEIRFRDIHTLLDPGDLLVVNRTRVRAARLTGRRLPTGGKTELLLTKRIDAQRWEALIRPAKKVSEGSIIECGPIEAEVLTGPWDGVATVTLRADGDIEEAIAAAGEIPLPPYFTGSLDSAERYQTVFADTVGSSAAPTAALHFTPEVLGSLAERGIEIAEVELQVGLDTFRPMTTESVADHRIHREWIIVDDRAVEAVKRTRERAGRVIAVGTTVVRTLESAGDGDGRIHTHAGETDLFITPGYRFGVVDAMITNFHAPRTTLIVMIAAVLGESWRAVYEDALERGYRFLSFGDAMYLEVQR